MPTERWQGQSTDAQRRAQAGDLARERRSGLEVIISEGRT